MRFLYYQYFILKYETKYQNIKIIILNVYTFANNFVEIFPKIYNDHIY